VSYTALALLAVAAAVALDLAVLRTRLLVRRAFWTAYAIIVVFQLVTNGWLTGRDIVTYDDNTVVGVRLVFAPVEDLLFGFSLVVQTLAWWVWWGARLSRFQSRHDGHDDGRDAHAAARARPPSTGLRPAP
jgi:lycopene cyclase domain-containing protein